jgi:hypothetical protein
VKYSMVSSNSTIVDATKFVRPHKSHMRQYTTQWLLQYGPTDAVLNRKIWKTNQGQLTGFSARPTAA